MRHVTWPILLACLTVPVFGQESAPHSIYENLASAEAIGGPVTTAEPSSQTSVNPQQSYDQAADALTQARTDVINRLANDPNYQSADHTYADSKKKYDAEIDDALSALSYDDTYNDLINTADRAGKNLQSLTDLSPGQPDPQGVRYAQERVDEARRQVEQYEDDALDNDKYVQQARQNYLAARAARDKILADAYAADPKVQQAQADLQRAQVALNAATTTPTTSSADQQTADRTVQQPYAPTGTQLEPQYVPQAPVVYDNGDSTAISPDYGAPYDYGYAYSPAVDVYPDTGYAYFPSFFIYDRSFRDIRHRYHDDHDRDHGRDDWRFRVRDHDGRGNLGRGDFDHGIADRRARFQADEDNANRGHDFDWSRANARDGSSTRQNTDAARLANDRQQAENRADSSRQQGDWHDRTRQWNDSPQPQPQSQAQHNQHDRSNDDRSVEVQRERDAQSQEQARQADQARQDAAQQAQARQQSPARAPQQTDSQQHAQQAPAPHARQSQQPQQSQQAQQSHDSSAHRSFGDSGHNSSSGGGGGHSSSHHH